jgi:hypothetical protein
MLRLSLNVFIFDISFKNPSFSEKKLKNKSPSAKAKGLEMSWLLKQEDFRTFCMNEETEKVYQKLVKVNELLSYYNRP